MHVLEHNNRRETKLRRHLFPWHNDTYIFVPPVNKIRRQWKLLLILQRRLEQTAEKILKAVKIYIYILRLWFREARQLYEKSQEFYFQLCCRISQGPPGQFRHVIYDTLVGLVYLTWELIVVWPVAAVTGVQ